jgi:CheY-like chemotaxis protein
LDLLLVEDDAHVRKLIRRAIEDDPARRVVEASHGEEALEILKTLEVQIVLTDVRMPGIDGVELTKEVKRLYPDIHVVAITSSADDTTRRMLLEAGASGFLFKKDMHRITEALDLTEQIGPDRRRTTRSRAIRDIWDGES